VVAKKTLKNYTGVENLKVVHYQSKWRPQLSKMLIDFENCFIEKFVSELLTKSSSKISLNLKCVATLPCETCRVFLSRGG